MTLEKIISRMESGESDYWDATELSRIIHDLRENLTRYELDIRLCQRLLGLGEKDLVAPALEKRLTQVKSWQSRVTVS